MGEALLVSIYIRAFDQFSTMFAQVGTSIAAMNPVMGGLTTGALAVGAGILAIGGASIAAATDFDQQMARIKGLTGASADQVDYYRQQLLTLSPAWDMSATSAAKALYFIISAGFSGSQAIDVLNYSAKSATASLADQATVADALTSMMNAYKDANVTAAHAANDLTKIEIYGKAQLSAFAGSLGFTMVTAHAAGISIDEASAAVSTLSQVSGNHGIRRISNEFDNLARSLLDVNAVAKRAQAQGLNFDEASFSTMTFIQKLQYLQNITGALSSNINDETYSMMKNMDATQDQLGSTAALDLQLDKANSSFMKLTGGAAAFIPAAILLSGKGQAYNDVLAQMHDQTDKVTDAFNTMRGTTSQQLKMLEITFQNLAIVIGLHLLPAVNAFLMAMIHMGRAIVEWTSNESNIEKLKIALIGIGIVIGFFVVPFLVGMVAAMWPIVLGITAIVVAGTLLGNILNVIVDRLGGMQNILRVVKVHLDQAFTNPAVQAAMQQLRQAFVDLQPALQFIGAILGGVVAVGFGVLLSVIRGMIAALPGLMTFFAGIVNFVGGLLRVIKDLFTLNFSDIGGALGQIGRGILQAFQGLLGGAVAWVSGFVDSIINWFLMLWDKLTGHSIVPDMVRDIVMWFGKLPSMVGEIFGRVVQSIQEGLKISGIGQAMGPLLESFKSLFGQLQRFAMDVLVPLGIAFFNLAKVIGGALWSALQGLWTAIQPLLPVFKVLAIIIGVVLYTALAAVVGILRGVAQGLVGVITFITGVVNIVAGIIRLITDVFTGKWSDLLPALKQVGQGILQVFQGVFQEVWGFISGFFEGLLGMFGVKTKDIEGFFSRLWDSIRNGVGGFFSGLGSTISGWIADLGGFKDKVGQTIGGWFSGIGSWASSAKNGLFSTIGGWISDLGQFKDRVFAAVKSWWDGAVTAVTDFVGNIQTFIANLATWLYAHNTLFKGFVDGIVLWVRQAIVFVETLRDGIEFRLKQIEAFFTYLWATITAKVGGFFQALGTLVSQRMEAIRAAFEFRLKQIEAFFTYLWAIISTKVGAFFQALGTNVSQRMEAIKEAFSTKLKQIETFFTALWDGVRTRVGSFFEWLGTTINQKMAEAKLYFQAGLAFIQQKWQDLVDGIRNLIQPWVNDIVTKFENLKTMITDRIDQLKTQATQKFFMLKEELLAKWEEIKTNVLAIWDKLKDALVQKVNDTIAAILKFFGFDSSSIKQVQDQFWKIVNGVTDVINNLINSASQWGSTLLQQFIDGINSKIQGVKDAVSNVTNWIGSHFPHSPAKEGPLRDAPSWGGTLMQQLTDGIVSNTGIVHSAALQAAQAASISGSADYGVSGGGAGGLALLGAGGGTTHITANFPNATDRHEIEAALNSLLDKRGRSSYQATRSPGALQGARPGY